MHMDRAINDGILVPWHKSEPEAHKTALGLLAVDKGGLTGQPIPGATVPVQPPNRADEVYAVSIGLPLIGNSDPSSRRCGR